MTSPADEPRTFGQMVGEFRNGALNAELTLQLEQVVSSCIATQKKGHVRLTLNVDPDGGPQLRIIPKVEVKAPMEDVDPGLYFGDEDGRVYRNDPNQMRMDLEERRAARIEETGA